MRRAGILLLVALPCLGQTCTILEPSNCPTTGVFAGPPTLEDFVTGLSTSLPTARWNVAAAAQPRILYSGQVVPASQTFMINDPHTCPTSGTCQYNNPTVIENFIASLLMPPPQGAGLKSLDFNVWISPLFASQQYVSVCATYGACMTPTSSNASWFARGLSTYDAVFAYVAANWPGVRIRLAPMFSGDATNTCNIQQNAFTELQVEQCAVPLWAAMVARWHVDDMTVSHEPCGVFQLELGTETGDPNGCVMTVADMGTFIRHAATAVRAMSQNPNVRVGAGGLISDASGECPGPANFWCDWYTNLMPANVLDFAGIDLYPATSVPAANYNSTLSLYQAMAQDVLSAGKSVVANESSAMRWSDPSGPGGEENTYWGCAASEWMTDGTFMAWARAIPGAWAPANGLTIHSVMLIEPLLMTTTDPNNNHCVAGTGFEVLLSNALMNSPVLSPMGSLYGVMAEGWNTSLQGKAHLTGRAHLGH